MVQDLGDLGGRHAGLLQVRPEGLGEGLLAVGLFCVTSIVAGPDLVGVADVAARRVVVQVAARLQMSGDVLAGLLLAAAGEDVFDLLARIAVLTQRFDVLFDGLVRLDQVLEALVFVADPQLRDVLLSCEIPCCCAEVGVVLGPIFVSLMGFSKR